MYEGEHGGRRAVDFRVRIVENFQGLDGHAYLAIVKEHHGFVYFQVRGERTVSRGFIHFVHAPEETVWSKNLIKKENDENKRTLYSPCEAFG